MKITKVTSICLALISLVFSVKMFIKAFEYFDYVDGWLDEGGVIISIVILIVMFIATVGAATPCLYKKTKFSRGGEINYGAIASYSISNIITRIVLIAVFMILTEDAVFSAMTEIDLGFIESGYLCGYYAIFREPFLIVNAIMLVDSIITFVEARSEA